jgi:hypothetical protein
MKTGANKPSIIAFAVGASLTGGLIGAWEAAALAAFDVQMTTSRGGAVLLALAAFAPRSWAG